jgi:hypothetical protein
MPSNPASSFFKSIRGKVWLASVAAAVAACSFALLVYLFADLVSAAVTPFVFVPAILSAISALMIGRWLSYEVSGPVEKLALLANSIERSPTDASPGSTGAVETDGVLELLLRKNRQVRHIVELMENAANGTLPAGLDDDPTDRLSSAFRGVMQRLSGSLDARDSLDSLRHLVGEIKSEIENAALNSSADPSAGIRESELPVLISRLAGESRELKDDIADSSDTLLKTLAAIESVIQRESEQTAARADQLKQSAQSFVNVPDELSERLAALGHSLSGLQSAGTSRRPDSDLQSSTLRAVECIRTHIKEVLQLAQTMRERPGEVSRSIEIADDLARRTRLAALNLTLQHNGNPVSDLHLTVTPEIEALASRAELLKREVKSIEEAAAADVTAVESLMEAILREAASLTSGLTQTGTPEDQNDRSLWHAVNGLAEVSSLFDRYSFLTDSCLKIVAAAAAESEFSAERLKDLLSEISVSRRSVEVLRSVGKPHVDPDLPLTDDLVPPHEQFKGSGHSMASDLLEI